MKVLRWVIDYKKAKYIFRKEKKETHIKLDLDKEEWEQEGRRGVTTTIHSFRVTCLVYEWNV